MPLANLKVSQKAKLGEDRVGGNYQPLQTGLHTLTIVHAYLNFSAKKAACVNLKFKADSGQSFNQQLWISSNEEKGCLTYYIDKKTKEEKPLPGFEVANHIALVTTGESIVDLDTVSKTINLWSSEVKKEVPTKVEMIDALVDKKIIGGVHLIKENKNALNTATGEYEPTEETREFNEVVKVFRERDSMTVVEIVAEAEEATFHATWAEKNTGLIDKSKKVEPSARSGSPLSSMQQNTPAKSSGKALFA